MLTKVKECIDISGGQGTIVPLNTFITKLCAVILYYIGKSKSDFKQQITIKRVWMFGIKLEKKKYIYFFTRKM